MTNEQTIVRVYAGLCNFDDPYGYGSGGGGYDELDFHNVDRISHVEASVGGAIWQQPDFEQHGRGQQHYDYY